MPSGISYEATTFGQKRPMEIEPLGSIPSNCESRILCPGRGLTRLTPPRRHTTRHTAANILGIGGHTAEGFSHAVFLPFAFVQFFPHHRLLLIPMLNTEDCIVAVVSDFGDLAELPEVNPSDTSGGSLEKTRDEKNCANSTQENFFHYLNFSVASPQRT